MSTLVVAANHAVTVQYDLHVEGAHVEGGQIDYLHGHGNIVPGLEEGLAGATVGEERSVEVPPELGYGERMDAELQRVPRNAFPPNAVLEAGMQFHARSPDGDVIPVWVAGIESGVVLIDVNHPLAGRTLRFEVKVLSVRPATAEELEHGHVHGPDAHGHDHGHAH